MQPLILYEPFKIAIVIVENIYGLRLGVLRCRYDIV